jgi:hypothetical protein
LLINPIFTIALAPLVILILVSQCAPPATRLLWDATHATQLHYAPNAFLGFNTTKESAYAPLVHLFQEFAQTLQAVYLLYLMPLLHTALSAMNLLISSLTPTAHANVSLDTTSMGTLFVPHFVEMP